MHMWWNQLASGLKKSTHHATGVYTYRSSAMFEHVLFTAPYCTQRPAPQGKVLNLVRHRKTQHDRELFALGLRAPAAALVVLVALQRVQIPQRCR